MVAQIEWAWFDRLMAGSLYRYELAESGFSSLDDAGMWVVPETVVPIKSETVADLPGALREQGVELHVRERLTSLKDLRKTSLHVSAIRMRNAQDWQS